MPLARTTGAAVIGVVGHLVQVEACVTAGVPGLYLIGIPDNAMADTRARVRAAVINSGLAWPQRHVTVSLYPASLPKRGSGFDLAIALALLAAAGTIPTGALSDVLTIGELGLDGTIRPVRGAVPAVLAAVRAGMPTAIVPAENAGECAVVDGITIATPGSLRNLTAWLRQPADHLTKARPPAVLNAEVGCPQASTGAAAPVIGDPYALARRLDLADVPDNPAARHALEVCAAGGHHLSLQGPPGSPATMLAERLPTILPPLEMEYVREIAAVHSCAGLPLPDGPPLVSPHHTTTHTGMRGSGGPSGILRPGSIPLAHRGVLFLDRASEFSAQALHTVRSALETGEITVTQGGHVTLPARIQLIISDLTCPCPDQDACACPPPVSRRSAARVRRLLDGIELHAVVSPLDAMATAAGGGESSATVADRVVAARERAAARLAGTPWRTNAQVPITHLRTLSVPADATTPLLDAASQGALSRTALAQVMRVAWTLADLRGADRPARFDTTYALALRNGEA